MLKKKFKFSAIISILIISLLILSVLVYNKKSFFINKVNEIAPNFVQKVRFYYFNLPHNLPSIPSSNPVTNDLDFKLSLKSLVFKNSKSTNLKIFPLNLFMFQKVRLNYELSLLPFSMG